VANVAPYFIILLCLTPDDFTQQEDSVGAQQMGALAFLGTVFGNQK
jgi:hypothetical protein